MKKQFNNSFSFYAVASLFLFVCISCGDKNTSQNSNTIIDERPLPEESLPTLKKTLKQNIEDGFVSCSKVNNGVTEDHKFTIVIGDDNQPRLHEIVDLTYVSQEDSGVKPVDISQNGLEYLGIITLKTYSGQSPAKFSFICSYNRKLDNWYACQNFDEELAEENNIPLQIDVKNTKGEWKYSIDHRRENWSKKFPFEKPILNANWNDKQTCSELIKRDSLKEYEDLLFGKTKSPTPVSTSKTDSDSVESGKVGDEGILANSLQVFLRSEADSTSKKNIITRCNQGTKVKILSIVTARKNAKWYKVEVLSKDKCKDNVSEAFINSRFVEPSH